MPNEEKVWSEEIMVSCEVICGQTNLCLPSLSIQYTGHRFKKARDH